MLINWLKQNKKAVIVHCLILSSFLLYLCVFSVPLFDRLEQSRGEAQMVDMPLPPESNDIRYSFGETATTAWLEIYGWAFINGQSPEGSTTYLVFKSEQATYVFKAEMTEIVGWTLNDALKIEKPDLTRAGFSATIPWRKMRDGAYSIGIYITRDDIRSLHYTYMAVIKSHDKVERMPGK